MPSWWLRQQVTYNFARLMEGVKAIECSAVGDAVIAAMWPLLDPNWRRLGLLAFEPHHVREVHGEFTERL